MKMLIYSKDAEGHSFMNEIVNVSGIKYFPDRKMLYISQQDGLFTAMVKDIDQKEAESIMRDLFLIGKAALSPDYRFEVFN